MVSDEEFNELKVKVDNIVIRLETHIELQKKRDEEILHILNTQVLESKNKIKKLKQQIYESSN